MARVEIDPQTGQEIIVEDAPQALAPMGPQIGAPAPLVEEPNPVANVMRTIQSGALLPKEEGPDFISRVGGPRPGQRQGGMMETLGQYATSDLGRNIVGALGVGLAGLRNPRDNGALQNQLMQMHVQGAAERAKANQQAEAMTQMWGAMTEASGMITAGDLEGASKRLSELSKNRAIMGNPAAMGELLKLHGQLENRARSQRTARTLAAGPEIKSPRDLLTRGGEMGLTMEEMAQARPFVLPEKDTDKIVSHFDPETQQAIVINATKGTMTTYKYGEGALPKGLKATDLSADTKVALEKAGVHIPSLLKAYNNPQDTGHKQAVETMAQYAALGQKAAGGSEQERTAAALYARDVASGKVKAPANEMERAAGIAEYVRQGKKEIAQETGYAGATGRKEADLDRLPGEVNRFFLDRKTMAPVTDKTVRVLQKTPSVVEVEPSEAQGLKQVQSGLTIVSEMSDLIRTARDLFPEKKDDITWRTAGAALMPDTMGRIDPRVARMRTLTAAIPNLVRALGDTANIAVAERAMTESALGLRPMTRSAAEGSLRTMVKILNNSLRTKGFEGINVDELLRGEGDSGGGVTLQSGKKLVY